ncbi:hypothetical protein BDV28DRAFT_135691 [Aspergillus coremiiformis]|uniref:Uncharacterized protein n=1 Tax=Aspergillus coremiiformis TaxID=138285 RepID=A0A5N6Z3A2_9EURO|nr:hypothetical protein BDV28DRAFT_135691 [Aspergillus coremiiformis]
MSDPTNTIQTLNARMTELITALEAHPLITTPQPHPTIFYVLDFVRNSHSKLKSIDAQKLQSGDQSARSELQDIRGRNVLAGALIKGEGPMAQMMLMMGEGLPVEFGDDVKQKVDAVNSV